MQLRTSVIDLLPMPTTKLSDRQETISTYLTKDVVDSFVTKINRLFRDEGQKPDPKLIHHLKWKVKPKIKSMMYSHDLWGNLYYSKVLSKANINEKMFLQSNPPTRHRSIITR
jgi:hypothetical protein